MLTSWISSDGRIENGSQVRVKQIAAQIECVAEAVRRIDAHHQSTFAELSQAHTGGRGQTGFAYAAFAAEQKNAHNIMVDASRGGTVRKKPCHLTLCCWQMGPLCRAGDSTT